MTTSAHPYPSLPTRVIYCEGTNRQIGEQHGEQVRDLISASMPVFFYEFFKRSMTAPKGSAPWEVNLMGLATKAVDPWLINKLWKQVPPHIVDGLEGLAAVTGVPVEALKVALVLPDLLPILQTTLMRLKPERRVHVNLPPRMGCSSFVADSPTGFWVGRNLDFPGVGYWDRYPVIQVSKPKGALAHVALTTVGVPLGGISGLNEAQVSVQLHQHYCLETDLSGQLPYAIAEDILRNAKTAGEALEILQRSRVASSWAFVVADGKTHEAFIYEAQPSATGIRKLSDRGGVLTHSNFYRTRDCQSREYATTERMTWDNYCRKGRLDTNVRQNLNHLTAAQGVQFLSEHFDPFWGEEKILNRTVSQVYNLQSYLLELDKMHLYFAEGDAPVHLRHYRQYDLGEILAGRNGKTENVLPGFQFKHEKVRQAKEKYILSFIAAFDDEFDVSLERAEEALELVFTPEAAYVTAMVNLRQDGPGQKSLDLLDKSIEWIEAKRREKGLASLPPEYFEICLYRARVLDLMGKRDAAIHAYHRLASHPELTDGNIRSLAYQAKPYNQKRVQRMVMPFSTYIPFD